MGRPRKSGARSRRRSRGSRGKTRAPSLRRTCAGLGSFCRSRSRFAPRQEFCCRSFRRASEPRLYYHALELLAADLSQAHEHGSVSVEVRYREKNVRIAFEQRFFHLEIGGSHSQDCAFGGLRSERLDVAAAQRAIPDETLAVHAPRRRAVRLLFARLRQLQRDPAHVLPRSHPASCAVGAALSWCRYYRVADILGVSGG